MYIQPVRAATLLLLSAIAVPMLLMGQKLQTRIPGQWLKSRDLREARAGACTAVLADGRMLVIGGQGRDGALATAEFLNNQGEFSLVSQPGVARSEHVCATLADGKVLVAGGRVSVDAATNAAELYSPDTDTWSFIQSMREARIGATLTRLGDGRLLIAGGESSGVPSATLEIFDPASLTFSMVRGSMATPRKAHAATVLRDGRVLIAGGSDGSAVLNTADIFDPAEGSILAASNMSVPREGLSATLMDNGRVLVAGGSNGEADLASTEYFDGTLRKFSPAPDMDIPRRGHLAFLMPHNNTVVIAGGTSNGAPVTSALQFGWWGNNYKGEFRKLGDLSVGRTQATAAASDQGELTMAGGVSGGAIRSATESLKTATVATNKLDYQPGDTVYLSGSGFQPGEAVRVTIHETPPPGSPVTHGDIVVTIAAAQIAGGAFANVPVYSVEVHDLGATFYLIAEGITSGIWAETSFTDKVQLVSVSVGAQTPALVTPGNDGAFIVTVRFGGSGATGCSATLSVSGLPAGASGIFGSNPIAATASSSPFTTLTVTTTGATVSGPFTVTATAPAVGGGAGCDGGTVTSTGTLTMVPPVTTTTTVTSASPSIYGDSVTFTATITGAFNPACGSVEFREGTTVLSTVTLSGTNTAQYITSALTAIPHTISAYYTRAASFCNFTSSDGSKMQVVNPKAITVTANAGQTKVYGAANPAAYTYSITSGGGLVSGDSFSGALTRAAGEPVGNYAITQGTLALSSNYALTYVGANFTITAKPITVTADSLQTKVYGAADPASFTYSITSGGPLVSGDSFSGALTRAAGEPVGSYAITQGTLALSGNYALTYVGANLTITAKPVTVTADALQTKVYGAADPASFTYSITSGAPLAFSDSFSGSLTRAAGEPVGSYAITQGTLALSSNYALTYVGANFTISARPTSTTLVSALSIAVTPVRVELTATVSQIGGIFTPVGSVTFTDTTTNTILGSSALSAGGVATSSTTLLALGQHVITATYLPLNSNFTGSGSGANTAPVAEITAPTIGALNPINTPFSFAATFTDSTVNTSAASAAWSFDDVVSVMGTVSGLSGSGTVTTSYGLTIAGVYSVSLTENDGLGGITITRNIAGLNAFVVVYDPSAGFVTGGGWINSQPGAYLPLPLLSGKATFGFVAKYKKGANVPEGNTEFQFHTAGMNFKSTSYDWLVVQGQSKASFKGEGTINGVAGYKFMVSVVDGSQDQLRMKITNGGAVVYDNMMDAPDDADVVGSANTILGGGNIQIHAK